MNYMSSVIRPYWLIVLLTFFSGCNSESTPAISLEEKIRSTYAQNNRLETFYQLHARYGANKAVLFLNRNSDSWWITNFTVWLVFLILPDIPEVLAGGGVIAFFYALAWWFGVTLTGGGILFVLAKIGVFLGVLPGVPPAIMGIVYLGAMFSLLLHLVQMVF